MYSVTMSSRTATDSGDGFGSSPNAYINSFTSVSWIIRGLYNLFGRDSVYVRYGDGEHVPPCFWSIDLWVKDCGRQFKYSVAIEISDLIAKLKRWGWIRRSFKE